MQNQPAVLGPDRLRNKADGTETTGQRILVCLAATLFELKKNGVRIAKTHKPSVCA